MTKGIRTYEELMQEKSRLTLLLQSQKQQLHSDLQEIKAELAPVKTAISFIGKMTTQDASNPLVNSTLNTVIDLVMRKFVLAKAGWFTKLVVPFFLKNYSSHFLDDKKDKIIGKIFSLFRKKNKAEAHAESNGKAEHHPEEETGEG